MKAKQKGAATLQEKIGQALSDGRITQREGPAMWVAVWCLVNRGKKLPEHLINCEVIEKLRDGDSVFFREVSEAMAELEREGATVDAHGNLVSTFPADARVMIALQWNKWESERAKIEVRLAELKEAGCRISKSRYLAIVKQDSHKST